MSLAERRDDWSRMARAASEPCAVCDQAHTVATFLYRPGDERVGVATPDRLPPTFLCYSHLRRVVAGALRVGWCGDEECRQWGELGQSSPCGRPYVPPEGWIELAR